MKCFLAIITVVVFFSCKKEVGAPDPTGKWRSGPVVITFLDNGRYGVNYLTEGDSLNPVPNDSVFGSYSIDDKRSVLIMQKEGHRFRETQEIIMQTALPESWEYDVVGDVLTYKNSNIDGDFIRVEEE